MPPGLEFTSSVASHLRNRGKYMHMNLRLLPHSHTFSNLLAHQNLHANQCRGSFVCGSQSQSHTASSLLPSSPILYPAASGHPSVSGWPHIPSCSELVLQPQLAVVPYKPPSTPDSYNHHLGAGFLGQLQPYHAATILRARERREQTGDSPG